MMFPPLIALTVMRRSYGLKYLLR